MSIRGKRVLLGCLMAVFCLGASGCKEQAPVSMQSSPAAVPVPSSGAALSLPAATAKPETVLPPAAQMTLKIYFATRDAMNVEAETRTVAADRHPARTALDLLLAGPRRPDLLALLPAGVTVRSLNIKDGIAYVNFSEAILKHAGAGSANERLLVAAVVNTLTEFPEITKVQILVNDKIVDTLYGHVDVSEPLSRSEHMIK